MFKGVGIGLIVFGFVILAFQLSSPDLVPDIIFDILKQEHYSSSYKAVFKVFLVLWYLFAPISFISGVVSMYFGYKSSDFK